MSGLPDQIQPLRLARTGAKLSGALEPGRCRRLSEMLGGPGEGLDSVQVDLAFSGGEARRAVIEGRISARLRITCQRCLQAMALDLDARPALAVGEWREAPEGFDLLAPSGDNLVLAELVEDELLIALPDHPRHAACVPPLSPKVAAQPEEAPERPHPFAVLAGLKAGTGRLKE